MRSYGSGDSVAASKQLVLIVGTFPSLQYYSINIFYFFRWQTSWRSFLHMCFQIYLVLVYLALWHVFGERLRDKVLLGSRIRGYQLRVHKVPGMLLLLGSWYNNTNELLTLLFRCHLWRRVGSYIMSENTCDVARAWPTSKLLTGNQMTQVRGGGKTKQELQFCVPSFLTFDFVSS